MIAFFHALNPDPDVEAFMAATGITNQVIYVAIDHLVRDLKTANLWTKVHALYPMVGGTADTCKYNLKDPRDMDAAYRLTFFNSPAIDGDGVSWNGTTQYASTHFAPGTAGLTSMHMMYYSLTASATTARIQMGGRTSTNICWMQLNAVGTSVLSTYLAGTILSTGTHTKHTATSRGLFLSTWVNSTTIRAHQNGVSLGTASQVAGSFASITNSIYLGAYNNAGSPNLFSVMKCGVASIGTTFSDAEGVTFSGIINRFCERMSRNTY